MEGLLQWGLMEPQTISLAHYLWQTCGEDALVPINPMFLCVGIAMASSLLAMAGMGDYLPEEVEIVERILHAFNVYPSCMLCPNGVGFAEHVPADKHLRNLWARLQPNVPIVRGLRTQR